MYKRFLPFIVLALLSQSIWAQRIYSRNDYIQMYARTAIEEMYRSGVPASITLAQGCLESGNGNSELSLKSNNHFGIKCHGWGGKGMRYNDDAPNECFRVYDSVSDSYADHSNFLMNNQRYSSLFSLNIKDYKGWAYGLKQAGYATDPKYPTKLIHIIEEHELYQYDQMSIRELNKSDLPDESTAVSSLPDNNQQRNESYSVGATGVALINGCRVVHVQAGDSPKKIADRYDINLWEIYNYNDFPKNHRLVVGELVYLQKKKKKADKNYPYHTIKSGESLHTISQKYGIRLENLYKLNNLDQQSKIAVGQKLSLRKRVR